MTNEAQSFVDQFAGRQDSAWPGTLRLLKVFMAANGAGGEGGDAIAQTIALMPEDALRPLVDVIVEQLVNDRLVNDIKVSTCSDIAEVMELIAPLPPENIAGLAAFTARQANLEEPAICGVPPKVAE
ncbi:MAG: hypothetical protein AAGI28_17115 [Pseudomonadota bacterium]